MTQSTSIGTIYTRNEIARQAFRLTGILGEGQTLTAQQISDSQESLNRIIFSYINQGLQLWKYSEASLFLTIGQAEYPLATSNVTETYAQTTTTVSAIATDLTITVTDDANISDGDFIGIVLDGGSIQWTTVNGVPAANVVTITDALTDDVSIGNRVFNYTTKISKPNNITQMRRFDINSSIDTELSLMSRNEYFAQPNKTSRSIPTGWYYDKKLESGSVYLWQTPGREKDFIVKFTYQKPFFVFDSAADQADCPREYMQALVYALAVELCPEYGVNANTTVLLQQRADRHLEEALMFDRETASIFLSPNLDESGFNGGSYGN